MSFNNYSEHIKILEHDLRQANSLYSKSLIDLKLLYYFFQRPIADFFLRRFLEKKLNHNQVLKEVDKFLFNEGGMFKNYVYKTCDKFYSLKNSIVLVPGAGYGKNLLQLAVFRPKTIFAFDLYNYDTEWQYVSKLAKKNFGVEIKFFQGDFDVVPKEFLGSFDFIISDAVLEHVKDLNNFAEFSYKFLKPGGIFYASYGPIWYGPGGDHIEWGRGKEMYDHLLLKEEEYKKRFSERFAKLALDNFDSCEGYWMAKEKLFSYLKAEEYLKILYAIGFKKLKTYAKISTGAIETLKKEKDLFKKLDKINAPLFDRFCSGFYLWMKK